MLFIVTFLTGVFFGATNPQLFHPVASASTMVMHLVEAATIHGGGGVLETPSVNVLMLNISLEEASQ